MEEIINTFKDALEHKDKMSIEIKTDYSFGEAFIIRINYKDEFVSNLVFIDELDHLQTIINTMLDEICRRSKNGIN